jgi:hypothetical protein
VNTAVNTGALIVHDEEYAEVAQRAWVPSLLRSLSSIVPRVRSGTKVLLPRFRSSSVEEEPQLREGGSSVLLTCEMDPAALAPASSPPKWRHPNIPPNIHPKRAPPKVRPELMGNPHGPHSRDAKLLAAAV